MLISSPFFYHVSKPDWLGYHQILSVNNIFTGLSFDFVGFVLGLMILCTFFSLWGIWWMSWVQDLVDELQKLKRSEWLSYVGNHHMHIFIRFDIWYSHYTNSNFKSRFSLPLSKSPHFPLSLPSSFYNWTLFNLRWSRSPSQIISVIQSLILFSF